MKFRGKKKVLLEDTSRELSDFAQQTTSGPAITRDRRWGGGYSEVCVSHSMCLRHGMPHHTVDSLYKCIKYSYTLGLQHIFLHLCDFQKKNKATPWKTHRSQQWESFAAVLREGAPHTRNVFAVQSGEIYPPSASAGTTSMTFLILYLRQTFNLVPKLDRRSRPTLHVWFSSSSLRTVGD